MPTDDYYREFAAEQRQRDSDEAAAFKRYRADQEGRHPHLQDFSDPSVNGPSGPVGYEWMALRGD